MGLSKAVVKNRVLILMIALILLVPAVFGMLGTRINYDMLDYLPSDMDTVIGQETLKEDFGKGAFSFIVVQDMPVQEVAQLKEKIQQVDHVESVLWYDSVADLSIPMELLPDKLYNEFNTDDATMLAVFFDSATSEDVTMDAIREIRQILDENDCDMGIIAKIENAEGIENLDAIIAEADGIMVARGDMGVEIPAEKVPYIQKTIIRKCNEACKVVITATQMLDSMIRNPRPTRAEVTDVANAVYDGTDAVMLSGETAMGKYPVEAVQMMAKIVEDSESHLDYSTYRHRNTIVAQGVSNISNAVCSGTVSTAHELNAKVIVTPSISGFTAKLLSKWRPEAPIIGLSPSAAAVRRMQIYWGVRPLKTAPETSTDKIIEHALEVTENAGYITEGDTVIISAGIATTSAPTAKRGLTNTMRVVTL